MNNAKRIRRLEYTVKIQSEAIADLQRRLTGATYTVTYPNGAPIYPTSWVVSQGGVGGTVSGYPLVFNYGGGTSNIEDNGEDEGGQGGVREPRFTKPSGGGGKVQLNVVTEETVTAEIDRYVAQTNERINQALGNTS